MGIRLSVKYFKALVVISLVLVIIYKIYNLDMNSSLYAGMYLHVSEMFQTVHNCLMLQILST